MMMMMRPLKIRMSATIALLSFLALAPAAAIAASATDDSPTPAEALAKTILQLPTDAQPAVLYFLDDQDLSALRATGQLDFAEQLQRQIPSSDKSPQPLYNKTKSGDGGIAVFHGNIFAEGFFRQHIGQAEFKNAHGAVITRKVIKGQPWFEWNPSQKSWTYRTDGAGLAILGQPSGPQNFFRGTTIEEWNVLRIYQILASPQVSATEADELEQKLAAVERTRYDWASFQTNLKNIAARSNALRKAPATEERNRAAEELFAGYLKALEHRRWDAIFLTPNQRIAQSWTKSALIQWTIEEAELADDLKTESLYVGIEFDYVELAAASRATLRRYMKNARLVPKDQYLPPLMDDET